MSRKTDHVRHDFRTMNRKAKIYLKRKLALSRGEHVIVNLPILVFLVSISNDKQFIH